MTKSMLQPMGELEQIPECRYSSDSLSRCCFVSLYPKTSLPLLYNNCLGGKETFAKSHHHFITTETICLPLSYPDNDLLSFHEYDPRPKGGYLLHIAGLILSTR